MKADADPKHGHHTNSYLIDLKSCFMTLDKQLYPLGWRIETFFRQRMKVVQSLYDLFTTSEGYSYLQQLQSTVDFLPPADETE